MCSFVQDKNDKFDWTRINGGTPSLGTGPSADHTGNGMRDFICFSFRLSATIIKYMYNLHAIVATIMIVDNDSNNDNDNEIKKNVSSCSSYLP